MFPPVLILTGGLGTRIQSLTPDKPKYLVPVNNEPFALHQLRLLKKMGFEQIVLCVGYRAEPIIELLGNGSQLGLTIRYQYDGDELLGTGGAIKKASQSVDSPFCVLYGDSYLVFDAESVYHHFLHLDQCALMTVYPNDNRWDTSNILMKNNRIEQYNKKQQTQEMRHIDFGFLLFTSDMFSSFNKASFDLSEVLQLLISQNKLAAYEVNNQFYEVGTPLGVKTLEHYLRQI